MSAEFAISVKNLWKRYRRYASVSDGIKEVLHPLRKKYHNEFWALKDVSFKVKKGETLGIIGRNGSGKSTLLQILCGVLQPTKGDCIVNGRIAALLELGAGFNPEFTGRENVYMSGALMGFTREEIDGKFEDIVDFAEIWDFIDEPVRTYSSGMFVRLAFATAINVDPDVLIVDEALAVGDMEFQHKCLNKIEDFKKRGKNLAIVSHNIRVISKLCDRVILLNKGVVESDCLTDSGIDQYFNDMAERAEKKLDIKSTQNSEVEKLKSSKIHFRSVNLYDNSGKKTNVFDIGQTIVVRAAINALEKTVNPVFGGIIYSEDGVYLGGFNNSLSINFANSVEGSFEVEYQLAGIFLQGTYFLSLAIHDLTGNIIYDFHDRKYSFVIRADSNSLPFSGYIKIPFEWNYKHGT